MSFDKYIQEHYASELSIDTVDMISFVYDGTRKDKKELELSKGYIFSTKLKTEAFEGIARTTHDIMSLNKVFGGEHEINNHDDGFIIRDAKRKIARAIGIDENISNNALRVLFGPDEKNQQLSLLFY